MKILNYIDGDFTGNSLPTQKVENPCTEEVIGEVVLSDENEVSKAVSAAKKAQINWGEQTIKARAQVIYKYRELLIENKDRIAKIISKENGKTFDESIAGVEKAIELAEFSLSIPAIIDQGVQEVSRGVEVKEVRIPLGVVSSITPFNFPMMVPSWTITNAIVLGNAIIIKDSELTPLTTLEIGKLFKKAGLPDGIFNVIHGSRNAVEAICDHPGIAAVTFVGSTPIAEIVYKRSTTNLKRCLALGGAKNHIIVTPNVNVDLVASEVLNASVGMSGQRCMAASVLVCVGENKKVIDKILEKMKEVKVGIDIGPLINKEARTRLTDYLEKSSGEILLDGTTDFELPTKGYYVGPSLVKYKSYKEMDNSEVFAPILEVIEVDSLEEALSIQNESPYANGASIYTQNGEMAYEAVKNLSSGMIGVNIGVPVPREPYGFGGLKQSKYGYGDITGVDAINFFSNKKKVTTKWNHNYREGWTS